MSDLLKKWLPQIKNGMSTRQLALLSGLSRHAVKKLKDEWIAESIQEGIATNSLSSSNPSPSLHNDKYYYNEQTDVYVTFLKAAKKPLIVSGANHRAMLEAYSNWDGQPSTINEIARSFSIPRAWFIEYKGIHGWTHDSEPYSSEDLVKSDTDVLVEDALLKRKLQLHQKFEKKKWRTTQENAEKWRFFEKSVLSEMISRLPKVATTLQSSPIKAQPASDPYILVMGLSDFHWGEYAWSGDTGVSGSREEAETVLFDTTQKIMNRLPKTAPAEIILPVGSDFFHVDGNEPKTTRGTLQDVDGTPTEIFISGCELMIRYIEILRRVAPVRLIMMSGNHDRHNGLALLMFLSAWYRNTKDVRIVHEFKARNYIRYHNNLLGFDHGDGAKTGMKNGVALMASEARKDWGETAHHALFTGHLHHEKVRAETGATIYQLPSLASGSRWSHQEGYSDGDRSLKAFIVDAKEGITNQIIAKA